MQEDEKVYYQLSFFSYLSMPNVTLLDLIKASIKQLFAPILKKSCHSAIQ